MGKEKLSKTKKELICQLNSLCFGMHGHLSILLKNLQCLFYFRKIKKEELAKVYFQGVLNQLRHIIVLTRLIEKLGGYPEPLDYKNNQTDYYCIDGKYNVAEKMFLLDSMTSQIMLKEQYLLYYQTFLIVYYSVVAPKFRLEPLKLTDIHILLQRTSS